MPALTIIPAVDIQYGRAVQLTRGVSSSEKVFGDPLEMALRWQSAGAQWLHVVDLDAAFSRGSNSDQIAQIVAKTQLNVEVTGGIRDDATLQAALDTGCARVNIGTAAVENPTWCDQMIATHGDKVAVAIDVAGESLATRGWTKTEGDLWPLVERLNRAGCSRLVVTDTQVDGTLTGVNVALLEAVCARTSAAVVASGGVSSADDVAALATLVDRGLDAVIIGTALYVGQITMEQALRAAEIGVEQIKR
jgi:phosphoribosylanthranilate isomerase